LFDWGILLIFILQDITGLSMAPSGFNHYPALRPGPNYRDQAFLSSRTVWHPGILLDIGRYNSYNPRPEWLPAREPCTRSSALEFNFPLRPAVLPIH